MTRNLSSAISFCVSLATTVCAAFCLMGSACAEDEIALDFFEKKIRPLLADNCFNCHSANTNTQGGLRVDDINGLLTGGKRGPAIVPGDPEKSLLLRAVNHTDGKLKMPPKKQLTPEQVDDLSTWIKHGAVWPKEKYNVGPSDYEEEYIRLRKEHWAWQPLAKSTAPTPKDVEWDNNEIDRHIKSRLDEVGLIPSPLADKRTLIRRVYYDLTGLPPSPEEVEAFLINNDSGALEAIVDRLLASQAFGERWGRHWLDVARFGESTGSSRNLPYPHAWRYRDYVIDAFNQDKPFNQFILQQIAGDLLPAESEKKRNEYTIATGFLALGVKDVNQRFKVRFIMDNVDEQIDAVSRAFLGLTVSCARCHDHKFDPVPTSDYYALAGIFQSTEICAGLRNKMGGGGLDYYDTEMLICLSGQSVSGADNSQKLEEANRALAQAREEFQELKETKEADALAPDGRKKRVVAREKITKLQAEVLALSDPAAQGDIAAGVRDSKSVADTEIRIRGEAERLGPVVPRGFLSLIQFPGQPQINSQQSGRLELAQWIANANNPLTSRVIVNRVWQHLFGQGLVRTVDNFGSTGDAPAHPALLDHLATRFIAEGWSIKRLIRAIVLTRVYQLGNDAPAKNIEIDPGNRMVWRHAPRRLDAEEIRDTMLRLSGTLSLERPQASAIKSFKVVEMRNNGPEARRLHELALTSPHRSIYLPLLRGITPLSLEVFDFAQQGMVTGCRENTTVVTQSLYLLNDSFVRQRATELANRLLRDEQDDAARIDKAFHLILGRSATTDEVSRVSAYLREYQSAVAEINAAQVKTAQFEGDAEPTAVPKETAVAATEPTVKPDAAEVQVINPDQDNRAEEVITVAKTVREEPLRAAWISACQALLGSAEFRFVK